MTKSEVYEALHSSRLLCADEEAPWGNYPKGRRLEEHRLKDGRFLQVAWNLEISSESPCQGRLNNWRVTAERLDVWRV